MVLILPSHGVAYFPIPKCANTSIKRALKEACPDEKIIDSGNKRMSASLYAKTQGLFRFTVIREPVERGMSGYGNRVIHNCDVERSLFSRAFLALFGLGPKPDPDTFFLNLGKYMAVNDRIRRHLLPQSRYLGDDLSRFDAIYRINELDRLAADLSERLGRPVVFGRHQAGGPKIKFEELSRAAAEALTQHFASDYKLLSDYFEPKPPPK